ncbi:membrane hypothetical protein [[Clostridium] ultunense Esp]|nr:membrane hypothetical protein [[Clostridium] ultunense Esp]
MKESTSTFEKETNRIEKEFTVRAIFWGIIVGLIMMALLIYLVAVAGMDLNVSPVASILGVILIPLIGGPTNKKEINIMQTTASAVALSCTGLAIYYVAAMFLGYEFKWSVIIITLLLANLIGICFVTLLRKQMVEDPSLPFPQSIMCKTAIDNGGNLTGKDAKILFLFAAVGLIIVFMQNILGIIPAMIDFSKYLPEGMVMGVLLMPMMLGMGYILGFKISVILLIGSLVSNLVLGPIGTNLGWYVNPQVDYSGMQNFNIPIMVGMSLFASVLPLIKQRKAILRAFTFNSSNLDEESKVVPVKLMIVCMIICILGAIVFYKITYNINPIHMLFFIILGMATALISVRIQAESGLSAALAFSVFQIVIVYSIIREPIVTLLISFMSGAITLLAQNTMMDLKTGYMLEASPKKQVWAQIIGIIPGIIIGTVFFYGLVKTHGLSSNHISYPIGKMYYSITSGLSGEMSNVFDMGRFAIGGIIGLALSFVGLPAGALAITLYLMPSVVLNLSIGGVIRGIIEKRFGEKRAETYNNAATGLVIGDALVAIVIVVLTMLM